MKEQPVSAPGMDQMKRTLRVDLTTADRKKLSKMMPGKRVALYVTGEVVDLNWHKPMGDQEAYAGGMTVEIKNLEIGSAADSEIAELFADEMDG